VRVGKRSRRRALAASALVLVIVLGALGLLVITSESRHPAPVSPVADPSHVEVSPTPEQSELRPREVGVGTMLTR